MRIRRRARVSVGLALAVVVLGSLNPVAQQPSGIPTLPGDLPPGFKATADIATNLCRDLEPEGTQTLAVSGPRAQWTRQGTDAAGIAKVVEFLRMVERRPGLLFAVNGPWTVVYDPRNSVMARIGCEQPSVDVSALPDAVDRIAISEAGDVAAHSPAGFTLIKPGVLGSPRPGQASRSDRAPQEESRVRDAPAASTTALVWVGRRLIVASRARISAVDPVAGGYSASEVTSFPPSEDFDHAMVYNGLTYMLERTGCIDVYVGTNMAPHLRRVTCTPVGAAADRYLAADATSVRVLAADGTEIWEGPRPTAISARIDGGTREMTAALSRLAIAPWTPPIPLSTGGRALPLSAATANTTVTGWGEFFPAAWWAGDRSFDKTLEAVDAKGWVDIRREGLWTTARGIAFAWKKDVGLVTPAGRTLAQLATALRGEAYTDAEVESILWDNRSLGDSFEGRLFQSSWVPVGAVVGGSSDLGLMFESVVGGRIPFAQQCDLGAAEPDEELTDLVRLGVPVAGLLDDRVAQILGPAPAQLAASGATVVSCTAPRPQGARFLLLRDVRMRGSGNSRGAVSTQSTFGSSTGLRYRLVDDPLWPVAVDGDVIAAVGGAMLSDSERMAYVRRWLDKVLSQSEPLVPLVLPVTTLDLVIAVRPSWEESLGTAPIPNVTLLPLETRPTLARDGDPCESADLATAQRQAQEVLIGLNRVAVNARAATKLKIGVAENAVSLLHPIFRRAAGTSIWMVLDQNGFVPVTPAAVSPEVRVQKELRHGTQVAALIVAQAQLLGVLSDAELTWIDLRAQPNKTLLNKLAGRLSIVNVSQKLGINWKLLEADARGPWSHNILFVAAAANVGEIGDGLPLEWKNTAKINVVGVGVAGADGTILPRSIYHREYIDLLAPGASVPTVGEDANIHCVDGTSFATAYVSAVAGIVAHAADGRSSAGQLRARLMATADWRGAYFGQVKGGLINAWRALDGLFLNLLTVGDDNSPPLELYVPAFGPGSLAVTGDEFTDGAPGNKSPRTDTIPWPNILRLQRTSEAPSATGASPQPIFRVSYIDNASRYVVLDNVMVDPAAAIPARECRERLGDNPSFCDGTNVSMVRDYIAALLPPSVLIRGF